MSQGYGVRISNFQLVLLTVGLSLQQQNIENVLDVLIMRIEISV
jgi:hypothetical protein